VTRNSETGAPGVSELPIFGNLFKSRSEDSSKRELIIFIKATIVNSDGSADRIDRAVYDKYMTDPRPLFPE
jgi:type II secretory pathway component GspD/PulD (secretin)